MLQWAAPRKDQWAFPGKGREGFIEEVALELSPKRVLKDGVCQMDVEEEGTDSWPAEDSLSKKSMQTWKSLVTEGTARRSTGRSAGLCGHVTCSGARLFQEEDRKGPGGCQAVL